jgi:hypothetical protein
MSHLVSALGLLGFMAGIISPVLLPLAGAEVPAPAANVEAKTDPAATVAVAHANERVRIDIRCPPQGLTAAQIKECLRDLAAAGPGAARARGDAYQWFETLSPESATEATPELVDHSNGQLGYWVARYDGKPYMLLSTKPDETMLWQDGWGLLSLWQRGTPEGRRIAWRFDERGAARFAGLTERSINAPLAILFDGRVVTAPRVREKISGGQAEIILRPTAEQAFAELLQSLPETDPNAPPEPAFGPVLDLVLTAGPQDLLDLDTGKVTRLDASAVPGMGQPGSSPGSPENHLDLGGITDPAVHGLIGWDLIAMPVAASLWDSLPASALRGMQKDFLGACKPGSVSFLTAKGELPETFIVLTREGGLALLQILAFTEDPEGVRIRYKLAP